MIVYFSGSRFFREELSEAYKLVTATLNKSGVKLIDNTQKLQTGQEPSQNPKSVYNNLVKQLDRADVTIFEASFPSTLHVGHEITLAIEKGKPVIVLYQDALGKEPTLFKGMDTDRVIWASYNLDNLVNVVADALEKARAIQDVRFNFFVSPKILSYLDWVAKKRMVPRSVFLRNLIEKEMKKDKDFR